jgi:hypothetical protein
VLSALTAAHAPAADPTLLRLNREDWRFLVGENEHVVGADSILAVNAAIDLAAERP